MSENFEIRDGVRSESESKTPCQIRCANEIGPDIVLDLLYEMWRSPMRYAYQVDKLNDFLSNVKQGLNLGIFEHF